MAMANALKRFFGGKSRGDEGESSVERLSAILHFRRDEHDKAIAFAKLALKQTPRDDYLLAILAGSYQRQGENKLAIETFRKAVAAGASDEIWAMLAELEVDTMYMEDGRLKEAMDLAKKHLKKAERLHLTDLQCGLCKSLSDICSKLDQDKDASRWQQKASKLCPDDKRCRSLVDVKKMTVAFQDDNFEELEKLATSGIRNCKELGYWALLEAFYKNRAIARFKMKKLKESLEDTLVFQEMQPDEPIVYCLLCDIYKELNNHDAASDAQGRLQALEELGGDDARRVLLARLYAASS